MVSDSKVGGLSCHDHFGVTGTGTQLSLPSLLDTGAQLDSSLAYLHAYSNEAKSDGHKISRVDELTGSRLPQVRNERSLYP